MIELLPLLGTAFLAGLLGSAHCLGMCGGLSGLFAAGANAMTLRSQVPLSLAYNMGRVLSYVALGGIIAALGSGVVDAMPGLAAPVRLLGGILIIVVGLQVAFGWRVFQVVERIGATVWNRLAPAAKQLIPATTVWQAIGLGLLWGWLPCGLVYSVLLIAATSANAAGGSLVMIAFGFGTMPAMIMSGLSAARLSSFMTRNRLGAGLLIVLLGIATLAMPALSIVANPDSGHSHHSMSS